MNKREFEKFIQGQTREEINSLKVTIYNTLYNKGYIHKETRELYENYEKWISLI